MEKVSVDAVDSRTPAEGGDGRELSDALGASELAINHYRLDPGTRLSGLHAHGDQEEVFLVVAGEATFETLDGEVAVESGEVIRFAPGEYQSCKNAGESGTNAGDSEAVLYALGVPRDTDDVRIPLACPECGHDYVSPALAEDGATPVLQCPDCGSESAVECPDCGGADMTARLATDGTTPVSACRDCGYESPTL